LVPVQEVNFLLHPVERYETWHCFTDGKETAKVLGSKGQALHHFCIPFLLHQRPRLYQTKVFENLAKSRKARRSLWQKSLEKKEHVPNGNTQDQGNW